MRIVNVLIASASLSDVDAIIKIIERVQPGCNFITEKNSGTIVELVNKDSIDIILIEDSLFSMDTLKEIMRNNILTSKAYLGIFTSDKTSEEKIISELQCDGAFLKKDEYHIFESEISEYLNKLCKEAS